MISTTQIRDALAAKLTAAKLFEKVMCHSDSNLGAALEHLRDNPSSIAVIVPGADRFDHKFDPDDEGTAPVRAEWFCAFDIVFSGRRLDKNETGDPKTLEAKDAALNLLFWDDLGVNGLIVLPQVCEPLAIEFENGSGREAWKLTADLRQLIQPV